MKRLFLIGLACILVHVSAYAQIRPLGRGTHAHPVNFRENGESSWGGVLTTQYKWDSSSGDLNDLSEVQVGEYVTYSDNGQHVGNGRPWKQNNFNPTIRWVAGTAGGADDTHSSPAADAGPADSYTATQYYGYHCNKCRFAVNAHGFHKDLMGPITISRYVELVNGIWQFRIVKNGATATKPLP